MANQIVVSAGAKVRNLSGVLTATSGVVSFLPIDVSLGIPQLDVNGKILVSQLPNSVMEYQGTWNAATNTPYLVNGVGNAGDVWLVSTGGVHNFGAGAITFVVSDQVIFSNVAEGSIWQKASGSNGTVTSVALTETGDSLNITGSPIVNAGTINIGFNGTNLQYVNGAGNLTTFPILTGYVTAVSGTAPVVSSGGTTPAISMAAATGSVDGYLSATDFAIFNAKQSALTFSSPLVNTSGTISIPAATTSVNGYLASADFTTFNNKQNAITLTTTGTSGASTLVGATLNIPNYGSALTGYVPYTGATQDVDLGAFSLNGKSLHIKGTAGNGHLGLKHQSAAATGSANESLIYADSLGDLSWQNANLYLSKFITSANTANRSYTFPNATCNIPDDSLVVHLAGTETITGAKTFSGYTTFTSTVDITSGLTFSNSGFTLLLQPPTLSVNRTVTLPNATGTLALTSDISYPVSSVFGRTGAVVATSGDYTTAQVTEVTNLYFTDSRARLALSGSTGISYNNTTGVITNSAPDQVVALTASTGISVTGTYPNFTITNTSPSSGGTVTSVAALTIGTSGTDLSSTVANSTTTPVITLNVPTASAANRGALSSADWTTFNNKQSALTNPVTGTGTTNYLPKFTGASTIGNSIIQDATTYIDVAGYAFLRRGGKFLILNPNYNAASVYADIAAEAGMDLSLSANGATKQLYLTQSGNLGLGVTPSAWATVSPVFQIGTASLYGYNNTLSLSSNAYYNAGDKYIQNGYSTQYYQTSGQHIWYNAPNNTSGAGNAITFTQAMTLTAAGRLLINKTNEETYQLDVNGTGRFSGDLRASKLTLRDDGLENFATASDTGAISVNYFGYNTGTTYFRDFTVYNGKNAQIFKLTGSTGAATFSSSVSIGGADQGYQLDVKRTSTGDATFDTVANFYKASTHNTGLLLRLKNTIVDLAANNITGGGGPSAGMSFSVSSGGTISTALTISSTGAATFSSSVTAGGTISASDYIQAARSSGGYLMGISNTVDADLQFTLTASGAATKYASIGGSGATNLVLVPNGGNIGIGTSSPNYTGYGAGMTVLSLATSTADKFSIIELVGNRGIGGNQNGLIAFINNNGTATVTSRITGINTTGSVLGGQLTFETKADAGSLTEAMRITSGGNIEIASGSIKTGTPSGGTAKPWKLGQDTSTLYSATRTIQVEIDGGTYYLLAVKSTDL